MLLVGLSDKLLVSDALLMHNKLVDLLIGSGLTAEDFNDDTLERCLDDLYEAGVTEVFYRVAAHALQLCGSQFRFMNLDSNSYHLNDAYDRQDPERDLLDS